MPRTVILTLCLGLALDALPCFSQVLMRGSAPGGTVQLLGSDAAVFETAEIKKDLPCTVTPVKPVLGFDLRFHPGYEISIPLRELAGEGDLLTIIFRVTAKSGDGESTSYFTQKFTVPDIEADARGEAWLTGGYDTGEGEYHVDWLMRDRVERVCSSNWDVNAALSSRDQAVKLAMAPSTIAASDSEFFRQEAPVERIPGKEPLKVKVLINFGPQQSFAPSLRPVDTSALVSILRNISRDPRICTFSLVAFNMNEQRVVYREDETSQIDFPELGKAVSTLRPGMIDYKKLSDPHSGREFLAQLISEELSNNTADAVIFAGPKVMMEENVPAESLKDLASVNYPVFYLNFNLSPQQNPWRDPIGTVVKRLRGYEYTISRPRDLWTSWSEVMGRIATVRSAKMKLVASAVTSPQ